MRVFIVGGGRLVYFLCRTLISKGDRVTVINTDKNETIWMARHLKANVIFGDGSDPRILMDAGILNAHQLIAGTSKDEDNLVICQLASHHFKVPKTLALVNDPDLEEVFQSFGITAVSPTKILASIIEERAKFDKITNLTPISEGKVNLMEIELTADSPVTGEALMNIKLPRDVLVAIILRNGVPIVPGGATVLQNKDRLYVITLPESHAEAVKLLTGETG